MIFTTAVLLLSAAAAHAGKVDMSDPRRALGREDDVRIDAQLYQDAVSSNAPITIDYQIQNLSKGPIGFADKISDTTYDPETRTITFSVGAEIPPANLPHIVVIAAGETKNFSSGGTVRAILAPRSRNPLVAAPPGFVQIRVNILRDLAPFRDAIARQSASTAAIRVDDGMFDRWVESNDSIFLNVIPVQWKANTRPGGAEQRGPADAPGGSGLW